MGAKNQENAREQAVCARSLACDAERGTPNATGANGLRLAAEREAIASPLTTSEMAVFGREGANKGASWCATGCSAPPVVVIDRESLCGACAETMEVLP